MNNIINCFKELNDASEARWATTSRKRMFGSYGDADFFFF